LYPVKAVLSSVLKIFLAGKRQISPGARPGKGIDEFLYIVKNVKNVGKCRKRPGGELTKALFSTTLRIGNRNERRFSRHVNRANRASVHYP
jgi:hypothetical protein